MVNLQLGSFYRLTYSRYITNPRVSAFILWPGLVTGTKIHLLNLSAIQLSTIDRIRLMQVLKRLIDASKTQTFTGRQLYRILKQTVPGAIRNCYRTFHREYVTSYALLNYGLNNEDFFKNNPQFLTGNNKSLYDLANREFLIKSLNFMTGKRAEFSFAKPVIAPINKPTGPMVTIRPAKPKFYSPTIRPAQPKTTEAPPAINIRPAKPTGTIPTTPTKPTTGTENNQEQKPENDNNIF